MKTPLVPTLLLLASAAVAAPGNDGVVPPAAPEDVLYAQNLLNNPGFEKGGFEKDRMKGWYAVLENGMEAKFESAAPNKPVQPFEGRKALRIFVKDPAKYSNKALLGSWDEFAHGANGGKGAPRADMLQLAPVKPGAKYALRFRWRASGIYNKAGMMMVRNAANDGNEEAMRYLKRITSVDKPLNESDDSGDDQILEDLNTPDLIGGVKGAEHKGLFGFLRRRM